MQRNPGMHNTKNIRGASKPHLKCAKKTAEYESVDRDDFFAFGRYICIKKRDPEKQKNEKKEKQEEKQKIEKEEK